MGRAATDPGRSAWAGGGTSPPHVALFLCTLAMTAGCGDPSEDYNPLMRNDTGSPVRIVYCVDRVCARYEPDARGDLAPGQQSDAWTVEAGVSGTRLGLLVASSTRVSSCITAPSSPTPMLLVSRFGRCYE